MAESLSSFDARSEEVRACIFLFGERVNSGYNFWMEVETKREVDLPEHLVHYYRGEPFRSLTALAPEHLRSVLARLDETTAWGLARFRDPRYLDERRVVEKRLREMFVAKGGQPILDQPIYFFLGRNPKFEERTANKRYEIRLSDLPTDAVSFTYGDSMISMLEQYRRQKGGGYASVLCRDVYHQSEIARIFAHEDYSRNDRLHIEAQVWIEVPLSCVRGE